MVFSEDKKKGNTFVISFLSKEERNLPLQKKVSPYHIIWPPRNELISVLTYYFKCHSPH